MISKEQRDEFSDYLTGRTKYMVGSILTLLEAAGMVGAQGKAVKELAKQEMWFHHEEVSNFFWKKIACPETEN